MTQSERKRQRYRLDAFAVLVKLPRTKFYGHTLLEENRLPAMKRLQELALGLKRANLEDPQFEKEYDVYTDDQVEARYLLDPAMMERIRALSQLYPAGPLSMSYYQNHVLILIPVGSKNEDADLAKFAARAGDYVSSEDLRRQCDEVFKLVDGLELYQPPAQDDRAVQAS